MTWRDDYSTNDEAGAAAWEWNHTLPADDAPGWADLYCEHDIDLGKCGRCGR